MEGFVVCPGKDAISGRRVRPGAAVCVKLTEEEEEQYERGARTFSRRNFGVGVSIGAVVAAGLWYGPRDDLRSRARLMLAERFPRLFGEANDGFGGLDGRESLDTQFAQDYMSAIEDVAEEMGIISRPALHSEEQKVRARAARLFFDDEFADLVAANPQDRVYSGSDFDGRWFNFVLYARLHVISRLTSPKTRLAFVNNLAQPVLDALKLDPKLSKSIPAEMLQGEPELWLERLTTVLEDLRLRGMMASFQVQEFDGGEGSLWRDEGRGSLAVYINSPVTMQSAQLIGEENYEEISPKLSTVLTRVLRQAGISAVSFEDYYLDNKYQPDPAQYRPSQFAIEFDLSLSQ